MELQRVSFETAKKLKEIGFDITLSELCYTSSGVLKHFTEYYLEHMIKDGDWLKYNCLAPTQELAKKWFREVHGINIILCHDDEDKEWYGIIEVFDMCQDVDIDDYDTYEEALEAALQKACEIIKERNKT